MEQVKLQEILEKHKKYLQGDEEGERANLRGANLREANLFRSSLPLWCGGLNIKLDRLQISQLIYHVCSMNCEDEEVKRIQRSLYTFANEFAESRSDLRDKKFTIDATAGE